MAATAAERIEYETEHRALVKHRTQFLLSQSSVFGTFLRRGSAVAQAAASPSKTAAQRVPGSPARRRSESESQASPGPSASARGGGDGGGDGESPEDEDGESFAGSAVDWPRLTVQPAFVEAPLKMRDYQIEGMNWLIQLHRHGVNGILADEMGTGKTMQTICLLGFLHHYKSIRGPHIVIVPKSILENWRREFARWCPALRTVVLIGDKEKRDETTKTMLERGPNGEYTFDVCITSYEMILRERSTLLKILWQYIVIDEAHRVKNEQSRLSIVVRQLSAQHTLLLTGTPLQNNLHELWALLNLLVPEIFSSSEDFDEWFDLKVSDDSSKERMIHQLHRILRPFMLRRLKADVAKDLPPKVKTNLFVGMTEMQREVYKLVLRREVDVLSQATGSGGKNKLSNILMQLRKACNHPYLFEGVEDRGLNPMGEHLIQNCGKLQLLDKLLTRLQEEGSRVLIFSQMTRILDILEDYCTIRGFEMCRIDGSTSGDDRDDAIDAYNEPGSSKFIFLLSTRAGGLGINLATADVVVLYDSDWNPQADLQAMDRAHRIGQKKTVRVFRLITEHTIEEKMVERAEMKLRLDAVVIQKGQHLEKAQKKLSKADMLEMIRSGAAHVFSAKDGNVSLADVDEILRIGRERTDALTTRLDAETAGENMLEFKMDATNMQVFEGVDYQEEKARKERAELELQQLMALELVTHVSNSLGVRERNRPAHLDEMDAARQSAGTEGSRKPPRSMKLPKSMRLPRMQPWYFFNEERLVQLQQMLEDQFEIKRVQASGETTRAQIISDLLTEPLAEERARLIAAGFPTWNRDDLLHLISAMARHGRTNFSMIAGERHLADRSVEELKTYSKAFWSRGPDSLKGFAKLAARVQRGEDQKQKSRKLIAAAQEKIGLFEAHENVRVDYSMGCRSVADWSEEEDRFLLCWAAEHGVDSPGDDDISLRLAARSTPSLGFYHSMHTRTPAELRRRTMALLRLAVKENASAPKKRSQRAEATAKRKRAQDAEDTKWSAMQVKWAQQDVVDNDKLRSLKAQLERCEKAKLDLGSGIKARIVPEESIPALVSLIASAGTVGMSKICSKFLETYPHLDVSKAQLILAIRRVAEKEKAAGKKKIWRILPEYLSMVVKVDGITPWTSSLSASSTSLSSSSSASASGSSASSSSATKPPAAKKSRVAKPKGKAGGKMQFPAASLPKLVEYLAAAGKRGVGPVVVAFLELNPDLKLSKRQIMRGIDQVAEKKKREGMKGKFWCIKAKFKSMLSAEAQTAQLEGGWITASPTPEVAAAPAAAAAAVTKAAATSKPKTNVAMVSEPVLGSPEWAQAELRKRKLSQSAGNSASTSTSTSISVRVSSAESEGAAQEKETVEVVRESESESAAEKSSSSVLEPPAKKPKFSAL